VGGGKSLKKTGKCSMLGEKAEVIEHNDTGHAKTFLRESRQGDLSLW